MKCCNAVFSGSVHNPQGRVYYLGNDVSRIPSSVHGIVMAIYMPLPTKPFSPGTKYSSRGDRRSNSVAIFG